MDESTLSDIAQLLSSSTGASTRAAACTAMAASTSGEANAPLRATLGQTTVGETIIRKLLLLTGDPMSARLALSALVNISEDEHAANTMTRACAVDLTARALLDDDHPHLASLFAGLLSNITRFSPGIDALVGKGMGSAASAVAVDTLLKLVIRIDRIPNVLWMSNACSTAAGRAALLIRSNVATEGEQPDKERQPLTWLLRLVTSKSEATRLAAASALRNCAMAEDCHDILVQHTNAIGVCLARLIASDTPIPFAKLQTPPNEVREIAIDPSKASPEPLVEIRLMLVEALLLLCKSQTGRNALRDMDAYHVLEDWGRKEENAQVTEAMSSIMDRIVAAEEGEQVGPPQLPEGMTIAESPST